MKTCKKCKIEKELSEFYLRKDGYYNPNCKTCVNEYYKINTKYRKSPEAKLKKKMYEMKVKYNLTPEEYAEIITKQGNKCAICGDIPKKMCIDHDHNTGKVRGMLCSTCNLAIGLIRDCPIRLEKAIAYLS